MQKKNLFLMVYGALFAALVFIATYLFKLPTPVGYIHLGDGFIFIAAAILPWPFALGAAAIGAGLSDLILGYASWVLPTIIIKCACAILFTNKKLRFFCIRNIIALPIAAIITVGGYYLFGSLIAGNFAACLVEMPLNAVQSLAGICLFCIFGIVFDKSRAVREILSKNLR